MKISCPSCQSSYKIADEKVQGRTVKVRCRKCGLMIHVSESGVTSDAADTAGPAEPAAGSAGESAAAMFSVLVGEGTQQDMSLREVVSAYNSGRITADTFIWADGQPDWAPLGQVQVIIDALTTASDAVDAAAAAAPADPAPVPAPVPEAPSGAVVPLFGPAPAARPAPAAGGLFGETPAAPAPAAVVRQERRGGVVDLFGKSRGAAEDDAAAGVQMFSAPAPAKAPGAREEQSVLFSLAALTAAAQAGPSTFGGGASSGKDDSGLIDLKALSAQPPPATTAASPAPVAIFDAAPVLGSPIFDASFAQLSTPEPVEKKKSYGLIIGVGVAIAGVAIAAAIVVVAMRQPPPPPAATTAAVTAAETAPPPATTAVPAGDSAAAAPATGGAPSATAPGATGRSAGTGGKSSGASTAKTKETATAAPPTAPATTKPPPSKNKCNCAPADLNCNMACSIHK